MQEEPRDEDKNRGEMEESRPRDGKKKEQEREDDGRKRERDV